MRTRTKALLIASSGAIAAGLVRAAKAKGPELRVVPNVDLRRYAGRWYEIARLPNWFERSCATDITATYTLRPDGRITVVNECRTGDGRVRRSTGTARMASKQGPNTKLKVTFFWPFAGDYWILELDPDYRWALIGEPRRKYLWILGREPRMDEALIDDILSRARQQGYDPAGVIRTKQSDTGRPVQARFH